LYDRVLSKPVGSKPEFVGAIVFVGAGYYHVSDDDGKLWHRSGSDLSLVSKEDAS
jgi:hypothetical protein